MVSSLLTKQTSMGGTTELERVTAYIKKETKEKLEVWAKSEERSLSWLVGKIIEEKINERSQQ